MKKLVLDLRSNSGGYLEQAYEVASQFLKKGKIVYYIQDKDEKTPYYDETDADSDGLMSEDENYN